MTTWIPGKPSHVRIEASVRWFDAARGYGFLALLDGQPDVFCHISVVRGAGFETLPEGATVVCDIVRHPKNAAVTRIHAICTEASPACLRRRAPVRRGRRKGVESGAPSTGLRHGPRGSTCEFAIPDSSGTAVLQPV